MKRVFFATIFLFFIGCEKKEIPLGNHPGAQIYHGIMRADVRCYRCHGDIGQGGSRAPSLITGGKTIERSLFVKTVLEGRNRMPPFASVLSEQEIEAIADWLEAVSTAASVHEKEEGSGNR